MEAPPPFPPMPMPAKSNTKLIWGIVIAVLAVCCIGVGVLLFAGYKAIGKVMPMFGCGYRYVDIRSAILHYANGHGGKLPNAKTWQDDIQPDLREVSAMLGKDGRPFGSIKAGDEFACTIDNVTTGIAYNSDLSGKDLAEMKKKQDMVLLYEIRNAMHNATGPYKENTEPAPKVMNAPRGWYVAPLDGPISVDFARGKKIVFEGNQPKVINSDGSVASGQ